jgi:hypothetical protein
MSHSTQNKIIKKGISNALVALIIISIGISIAAWVSYIVKSKMDAENEILQIKEFLQ